MKQIFISMPMREKTREEILRGQERLLELAGAYLGEPVKLIETYLNEEMSALECLGESIKRMAGADYVLFAEGFENARGCQIELACAGKYDKAILIEDAGKIEEVI